MRNLILTVLFLALGCFAFGQSSASDTSATTTKTDKAVQSDNTGKQDDSKVAERLQNAADTLHEIFGAPDKGIPEELLSKAKCVIVIPGMKKAGFVIGGRYGRGFSTCRLSNNSMAWSAPAPVFLGGGSWGAQIGAEGVDVVMLVMDDKGVQHLLSSKFKVGVDASAAAGPVGRSASADTNWKLNSEILTYSRAKGLFAGIELNGAEVKQDEDTTKALYGKDVSFRQILAGQVRPPAEARPFLAEVHRDFAEARASK
jgi:lipid-binding SYLF domain-containing protein